MTTASVPRTIQGYTLPKRKRHGITDSFRGLMAAVISRALADLGRGGLANVSGHVRDEAMAWGNGPDCEAFCQALDMDYRTIQERGAALYRRFLEEAEGQEKVPRRPRQSGTGAGKPRPMAKPENGLKTAMVLIRKK
jgi:hypothetical protein